MRKGGAARPVAEEPQLAPGLGESEGWACGDALLRKGVVARPVDDVHQLELGLGGS